MKVMTNATKNTIIRMLGNLHCGKSDWQAIEFVFSKMSKAQKDLLKPRQVKALEKFITKEHQRNYFEYRQINDAGTMVIRRQWLWKLGGNW